MKSRPQDNEGQYSDIWRDQVRISRSIRTLATNMLLIYPEDSKCAEAVQKNIASALSLVPESALRAFIKIISAKKSNKKIAKAIREKFTGIVRKNWIGKVLALGSSNVQAILEELMKLGKWNFDAKTLTPDDIEEIKAEALLAYAVQHAIHTSAEKSEEIQLAYIMTLFSRPTMTTEDDEEIQPMIIEADKPEKAPNNPHSWRIKLKGLFE